jgi:hypothetical protein
LVPPGRSLIIVINMGDPPPMAKWHMRMTTTKSVVVVAEADIEPAFLDEESRGATTKDDRTVMGLLRSLPANIVGNYIYPFAVKIIKNREELIKAVDAYLDDDDDDDDEEEKNDDEDVANNRTRYQIGDWDVSGVDDFTSVFDYARNDEVWSFNEDLSRWNVANGTSFVRMFFWLPCVPVRRFPLECGECNQLERNVSWL